MENEILQDKSIAFIAAGICALAMSAAAWGLTKLWTTLIETIGRNPQVKKMLPCSASSAWAPSNQLLCTFWLLLF